MVVEGRGAESMDMGSAGVDGGGREGAVVDLGPVGGGLEEGVIGTVDEGPSLVVGFRGFRGGERVRVRVRVLEDVPLRAGERERVLCRS